MYTDFLHFPFFPYLCSVKVLTSSSDLPEIATRGQHKHICKVLIPTRPGAKNGQIWHVAAETVFQGKALVRAVTLKDLPKKPLALMLT